MNLLRSIYSAAATGILLVVVASPCVSFADDMEHHREQHQQMNPEHRQQWIQMHLDKAAARLEIKASQQSLWEAYSSAARELMTSFGERKPMPQNADAAAMMRQRAERATAVAQNLVKLADATEKLQSVLNEDQRKVLDSMVRMQARFLGPHHHGGMHAHMDDHEHGEHGPGTPPGAPRPASKGPAQSKSKN